VALAQPIDGGSDIRRIEIDPDAPMAQVMPATTVVPVPANGSNTDKSSPLYLQNFCLCIKLSARRGRMTMINLNAAELAELSKQDPSTSTDGGFQALLVSLQNRVQPNGDLTLTPSDLECIPRYAFDYGNGGWEDTLATIFSRNLGARLGR
jgi:hypothetical protein